MTIPRYEIKRSRDDAVYQYLIDHARPTPGGMRVVIFLKGRYDWDSRIRSRMNGKYRQEESDVGKEIENMYAEMHLTRKKTQRISDRCQRIDKTGNLFEKCVLAAYRWTRNKLFKN